MAHKKGVGSTKNGRDSAAQRLGTKRADGQFVLATARLRAGHARPLRNMVMWDVGRPAPRPPGRFAAM